MSVEGTEHLRKIVNRWDSEHEEEAVPLAELGLLLFQLDLLVADLRAYRSRIEQELAKRAETKLVEFPGGTAEIKGGTRRKAWDHPMLLSLVVDRAMEQGIHPRDAIQQAAGIGYWRTGALRKLDIDPDAHSTIEYGPPSVIVRAKERDADAL